MKHTYHIILFLLSSILYIACTTSAKKEDKSTDIKTTAEININKKTQALLLVQDFEFDASNKNKVSGKYIPQNKITIPQNLTPQNKWIMFEGPVLENDLVAYRFYADSRHRFDIYGKTVTDLVMDTVSWDYHNIMDWGSDILKVGNSLGLGSPAIWYKDSLHTLSICEEKTIEVVENSNSKSIIRTTFKNLNIENQQFDLTQDWIITEGQPWSEIQLRVINGTLPLGMCFATGIAKHLPKIKLGETDTYFYAMNWGKQSFHKENMGMAILADKKHKPKPIKDHLNHAYAFTASNKEVRYKFLSAWEKDNNKVRDASGFKLLVERSCQ